LFCWRIELSAIEQGVQQTSVGWQFGNNYITPFNNPALESYYVTDGSRRLFYCRERDFSLPQIPGFLHTWKLTEQQYKQFKHDAYSWPLDFLGIEIDQSNIRIQAGPYQFAPVFIVQEATTLHGHWDPSQLYPYLKPPFLNTAKVAQFLYTNQHYYSKETMFTGLYRLTQAATAKFSHSGLNIQYPQANPYIVANELKPNTDVVGAFIEVCQFTLRRSIGEQAPSSLGISLSGGADSCVIAGLLRHMFPQTELRTITMLTPGDYADQQPDRLTESIQHF